MFRGMKSPSPASSNYDFALRHERVKLFAKVLKQFDANITRTVQAMREVAGSLSLVGQTYHGVAQCVNCTNPHSAMNRTYPISSHMYSNRVVENYGADLNGAANIFASEMKGLREGEQYVAFNGDVHQTVLTRLHEVMSRVKKTSELGDDVTAALRKAVAAKKIVQKKEAKYIRLGKPLTESKRHAKQAEKMRQREQTYEVKLRAFDTEYEALMQRQLYVAGHTLDDFLDANTVYVAQILKVLSCLAPHGADAVANMVNATEDLANRLGIAPEDQVASKLKPRDVNTFPDNKSNSNRMAASKNVTPVKGTPGRTSHCSSHNFTSYYQNRKHRGASADQAPPTARAFDEGENDSNNNKEVVEEEKTASTTATVRNASTAAPFNFWLMPDVSQGEEFSSYSPQGRSVRYLEPDPTPPTPRPFNSMERFNTNNKNKSVATVASVAATAGAVYAISSNGAMPIVPRSGGAVIQKRSEGATVTSAAVAKPQVSRGALQQKTSPLLTATAGPTLNLERSVTLSPGRAPFGDGMTPPFHQGQQQLAQQQQQRLPSPPAAVPSTTLSDARSPSDITVSASTHRRSVALLSQAAQLGLDRARSTEPFDDNCPKGVVSYTSLSNLQPVSLLSALEAEADWRSEAPQERHANPLAPNSGSGGLLQQQQLLQQKQPRKSTRRSGTLPAALNACAFASAASYAPPCDRTGTGTAVAAPAMIASAPPPDDTTLSSSVNSHFFSESNAASFQESLSFSYGQTNDVINSRDNKGNNRNNPFLLSTSAGPKSHSNNDAWETETGGVTGRSHAMSTSYALDSPAYAPHLRGMEGRSWEDNNVHACSPA